MALFSPLGAIARARDVEPVGSISGAALLAGAKSVATHLGVNLADLAEKGVDWVFEKLGITSCSDANKRKYRKAVRDATLTELQRWLDTKRVQSDRLNVNATDNCLKFALAEAARRAKREAERLDARPDAASVRRRLDRSWPSRSACFDAMRAMRTEDGRRGFLWPFEVRQEAAELCRQYTTAAERSGDDNCPPIPLDLQLIGVGRDRWCTATAAEFEPLIQMVRAANLTPDERQQLLALPYPERGAAFRALIEAREGGSDWLWWVVGVLVVLGLGGLAYKLFGGEP